MSELLPCPFCGSKASYDQAESIHVSCTKHLCPANDFGTFVIDEEWNTRASPWVSVEDRLPEEGEYLCLLDDESPFSNVCLSRYTKKVVPNWEAERYRHSLITHWMPLPEPPEVKP